MSIEDIYMGRESVVNALRIQLACMKARNNMGALEYRSAPVMYGNGYEAACAEIIAWMDEQGA